MATDQNMGNPRDTIHKASDNLGIVDNGLLPSLTDRNGDGSRSATESGE